MEYERKISAKGSLTVPSSMRRELGIDGKEKVVLVPQLDGDILIKRIEGTCVFCSSYDEVTTYKGKFICKSCLKQLCEGGSTNGK